MTTRRCADSVYLQYIWDAIETSSADRTIDFDSIFHFIRNERDPKCDASKLRDHLGNAIRDKCLTISDALYRKADWSSIPVSHKHDSYCFHCHLPGPVVDCPTCFRVFHESCFRRALESKAYMKFPDEDFTGSSLPPKLSSSCVTCRRLRYTVLTDGTTSVDLQAIFRVVLDRMRRKSTWESLSTIGYVDEISRNRYFAFKGMDTRIISDKLSKGSGPDGYPTRTHLLADMELMIHNVAIIYGTKNEMYNSARQVLSLVQKELYESSLCVDCYVRSKGGRPNSREIVEACRKPHQLIWHQFSSWSFRPCKVLRETEDGCECVCFDGRRERLTVPRDRVFLMEFTATQLGLHITPPLKRALNDLQRYVQNQRRITPDFFIKEGLMLTSIQNENCDSSSAEGSVSAPKGKSSGRSAIKRPRSSAKHRPTSSSVTSLESTRKSHDSVKSRSSVAGAHVAASAVNLRASLNVSDDSDDDDSSSSSDSLDSDVPPPKRLEGPLYNAPTTSGKVTSSASRSPPGAAGTTAFLTNSSTSAKTASAKSSSNNNVVPSQSASGGSTTHRPFLARPAVTDSDSDPATSVKSSVPDSLTFKFSQSRRRTFSSSSSSSCSSSSRNSGSTLTDDSIKRPINDMSSSGKAKKPRNTSAVKSRKSRVENGAPAVTSVSRKPALSKKGVLPGGAVANCTAASVSPTALSSSSGIGSSLNGDSKSVETSPGDNIHSHEDRNYKLLQNRLKSVTQERDEAQRRIRELEQQLRSAEAKHMNELLEAKRGDWCRLCLARSLYFCCPGVSYCSQECQLKDWDMGHEHVCKRAESTAAGDRA